MTNKLGRPVKTEPNEKKCTICDVVKDKENFRLEPISSNPSLRRNQCNECRRKQKRDRDKATGYWKKMYNSMSKEDKAKYIKKKSEQNQHRFKTNPEALMKKKLHDKSDNGIYSRYKGDCNRRNRKKRGILMLLKFEEFSEIINKPCIYCNGVSRGVDRIDSNESYTVKNSAPCCKICNQMKNSMTKDEFISHIRKIIINANM